MIAVARSGTPGSVPRDDRTFADWVKGAAGERNLGSDAACDVFGVEHATRVVAGGPPHRQRERSVVEGWQLDSALGTGRGELLGQRVDDVAQLGDRDPRQGDFRAIPPPAVAGHDAPARPTAAHPGPRLLDLHRTVEGTTVGADHPDGVIPFEPRHGGIDAQAELLDVAVVRNGGALGQSGDRVGRDTAPLAGDHHVAQDGQRGALANARPGSRAEPRHRALQLGELAGGLGDVGGHRAGGRRGMADRRDVRAVDRQRQVDAAVGGDQAARLQVGRDGRASRRGLNLAGATTIDSFSASPARPLGRTIQHTLQVTLQECAIRRSFGVGRTPSSGSYGVLRAPPPWRTRDERP